MTINTAMKFLVTGATSGLGRNAVEWLCQQGHQVYATGRNQIEGEKLTALGATFTALDLICASDADYQQLLSECDIVWHCAAYSSPWGQYKAFYQANTLVTERLAHWAGELGIKRFIHISTPALYFDFQSHRDIKEEYLAKQFANHYAATKYLAEQAIQRCVTQYPDTTYLILRPRGLFGPHDRVIVPRVLAQIKRANGILHLPHGGHAYLDLTFVLNVVYALFKAATNPILQSGEVFNITNQQPCQLHTLLAALIQDRLHIPYQIRSLPYSLLYGLAGTLELVSLITQKEPALTRYSIGVLYFDMTLNQDKAINRLGYLPPYCLAQGIAITANWLQQYGGLGQREQQYG